MGEVMGRGTEQKTNKRRRWEEEEEGRREGEEDGWRLKRKIKA